MMRKMKMMVGMSLSQEYDKLVYITLIT